MSRISAFWCLFAAILAIVSAPSTLAQQSRASFAKAIANESTSPSYVLITVVDDKSGSRHTVCTLAQFLLGAIHAQHHIPYTRRGERTSEAIALATKAHIYHFSQADALNDLKPRYTPQILAQVQVRLKKASTPDLVKGVSDGGLNSIYTKSGNWDAYRDALAYVLVERGLNPRMADMTGGLYLSP